MGSVERVPDDPEERGEARSRASEQERLVGLVQVEAAAKRTAK
jgi:hypothetical protein